MEAKGKNNLIVDKENLTIKMSRVFDAPLELVWKIYTDPVLIPKWWARENDKTVVDKMDVRVGGEWRYVSKGEDGVEYAFRGKYLEVIENELLKYTFEFEMMPGNIVTESIWFKEVDGRTELLNISTYGSVAELEGIAVFESKDGVDTYGMEQGAVETWDRLERLLETKK